MWIVRDLEPFLVPRKLPLSIFKVWLLLGPRQAGKSSLLKHCAETDRMYVTLDDLQVRMRAKQDPSLFVRGLKVPFCIDEIQYVPELLSEVKKLADEHKVPGGIWLTGSQNFEVMKGVQESLSGRVAILHLFGLTDTEKKIEEVTPQRYFDRVLETAFPQLCGLQDSQARDLYLASYVQTYIERDVRELLGIEKRREFEIFLKVCALRTGQLVNYDDMARDTGVSPSTVKEWLSLLEDSFVLKLLYPWHSNRSKRLIKTPKLYFLDVGLACFLMGWRTADQILYGPCSGAIFETHLISNVYRQLKHRLQVVDLFFWRTKDGKEVDLLIEKQGTITPVEIKLGTVHPQQLLSLEKLKIPNCTQGYVVSLTGSSVAVPVREGWSLVSPNGLYEKVLGKGTDLLLGLHAST